MHYIGQTAVGSYSLLTSQWFLSVGATLARQVYPSQVGCIYSQLTGVPEALPSNDNHHGGYIQVLSFLVETLLLTSVSLPRGLRKREMHRGRPD